MPTRNVSLTTELDTFVSRAVQSGRYRTETEVFSAALRSLEREEHRQDTKLAALQEAIDEGDNSGLAEGDVFARVRSQLKLRPPS